MAKKAAYNEESISQLKGADRVRLRPAVIFGSDGIEGCEHAVFEILSNSIDEAREGYGKEITVTRFLDGSVEVVDHGRGMPMDYNEKEKRWNWELLFCEMYAGSKYNTNNGGTYEYSLGLNGLGLCATQYASEYMDAEVHKNGFRYEIHFKAGEPVSELKKEPYGKKDTGTRIRWKPDIKVFTDIDIPLEYYQETILRQSVVNAGIKFILRNQTSEKSFDKYEYCYENGIVDYIKEFVGDDAFSSVQFWQGERKGRDRADLPEYKVKLNVALCFSNKKQLKEYYHNSSFLEHGGAPEKAVKSAFVSQIDSYLKANSKYLKSDSKINFQDVEDCLVLVSSSFSTQTSYENQTKKAITNKFIQEAMTEFLRHQLEVYFIENRIDAEKIAEQVLINMRSRVKAETTRLNIKKTLQSSNSMTDRIEKFVDCRSKDVSEREIFIVEGDSALGACKQARDSAFQAVMPVRGKILNCLKAEYPKIFKNDIITDLIKVLGCGVEVSSKANKNLSLFSMDNLRWSKVIICTDADVDGYQIRTLILTMIYRLMPTLIKEGKVFIAESPLYEITCKDETWFCYTEKEKQDALHAIGDKKYTIQRSKGLGENEPEMMWLTTMNPKTRRLIKVEPDYSPEAVAEKFDLLLGDNLQGRKDYIAENGAQYIDMTDLS
ncbi:MAG: toprim domain-containing protein [Ruminococcus sp.]|nr:toprim domain-containing protein [Ruminococcus sp.]MDY3894847.1 toprim domain-containing protein [Candidatus Fimenecus sp.]